MKKCRRISNAYPPHEAGFAGTPDAARCIPTAWGPFPRAISHPTKSSISRGPRVCAPRVRIARIRVLRCSPPHETHGFRGDPESAARAHSDHLDARSLGAIHQQPPSVVSQEFAGILRLRRSMPASGGPALRRHASSDALLLVSPPPWPRPPDRHPSGACHNLLDELLSHDTRASASTRSCRAAGSRAAGTAGWLPPSRVRR